MVHERGGRRKAADKKHFLHGDIIVVIDHDRNAEHWGGTHPDRDAVSLSLFQLVKHQARYSLEARQEDGLEIVSTCKLVRCCSRTTIRAVHSLIKIQSVPLNVFLSLLRPQSLDKEWFNLQLVCIYVDTPFDLSLECLDLLVHYALDGYTITFQFIMTGQPFKKESLKSFIQVA